MCSQTWVFDAIGLLEAAGTDATPVKLRPQFRDVYALIAKLPIPRDMKTIDGLIGCVADIVLGMFSEDISKFFSLLDQLMGTALALPLPEFEEKLSEASLGVVTSKDAFEECPPPRSIGW